MNTPDLRPFVPADTREAINEALRRTRRFAKATGIESVSADLQVYDAHLARFGLFRHPNGSLQKLPPPVTIEDVKTIDRRLDIEREWEERWEDFYPDAADNVTFRQAA